MTEEKRKGVISKLLDTATYAVSLPERVIRSSTALAGGLVKEMDELLLPKAIKNSTTHELFVGKLLRFAIEDIAQVEGKYEADEEDSGSFMAKKAAGSLIEGVGLAAFGFSPLWVLVIASDSLKASTTFLNHYTTDLKEQGIIPEESKIDTAEQLFVMMGSVADKLADNIDTPPLSKDELKANYQALKESVSLTVKDEGITEEQLEGMMEEIEEVAQKEDKSLLSVAGTLGLYSMNTAKAGVSAGKTTVRLVDQHIFDHYRSGLKEIHNKGFTTVTQEAVGPYSRAVAKQFSASHETTTEKIIKLGWWKRWRQKRRDKKAAAREQAEG